MANIRRDNEAPMVDMFSAVATKLGMESFRGQGANNRLLMNDDRYFQFGDLRVDATDRWVLLEAESAGGVTNLAKYWYLLAEYREAVSRPISLVHLFQVQSTGDYGSHLMLWDFLAAEITRSVGEDMFTARRFTYGAVDELDQALSYFESQLGRS